MKPRIFNQLFLPLSLTRRPKIFAPALLAITLFFAGDARAASPGALDLSFGDRGTASFAQGSVFQKSYAIVAQPDGKVVVAGYFQTCSGPTCTFDFLVIRYNTNGTLDTSFDTDGIVTTDNAGQDETAYAVAIQADGKIVVAGGSIGGGPSPTNIHGFKLVRYNTDGSLDTNFGTGGRVYESFNDLGGTPQTMLIQPDGKIVVAGADQQNLMLYVARFNTNGGLDTNFGTSGRIISSSYSVLDTRLARQSDGKLIIAARSLPHGTVKLIRFDANGTLDGTFGGGTGVVTSTFSVATIPAVAVQADDKILLSGQPYFFNDRQIPPLKRFNADGTADNTFVPDHGPTSGSSCARCTQSVARILVLPDGRFYLAGTYLGGRREIAVSRYLSNGSLDYSYGFHGTSLLRPANTLSSYLLFSIDDAALQADGKVVVTANDNSGRKFYTTRATATVTPPSMRGDFDGDRKTDFAVFRPSTRFWYVLRSSDGSSYGERYGADGDVILPGDYNYDLKTDLSVFRPSENVWYVSPSLPSGGGNGGGAFGQTGDIRVQEDYDGDGYTDLAVFRPSNGTWTIRYSNQPLNPFAPPVDVSFTWGVGTDRPVPADYDGDGQADLAVFRPSTGDWHILRSSDGLVSSVNFGLGTDKTVQADYDGDLKTDIAVYRDGNWYILRSSDNAFVGIGWGIATDKPVPGDYDGDGKFDVAVYRPSEGAWYVLKSSDSGVIGQQWGISEDTPIPFTFVR